MTCCQAVFIPSARTGLSCLDLNSLYQHFDLRVWDFARLDYIILETTF